MSNQFYTFTQTELKVMSERIKAKMEEKGLSQVKLANRSGVSRPTINEMLHGYSPKGETKRIFRNPEPITLKKLCDALDCEIEYLIGEIEQSTHDLQFICEYTGLTESAVNKLHSKKNSLLGKMLLSTLIEESNIIERITDYWKLTKSGLDFVELEYTKRELKDHSMIDAGNVKTKARTDMIVNGSAIGEQTFKQAALRLIQDELDKTIRNH